MSPNDADVDALLTASREVEDRSDSMSSNGMRVGHTGSMQEDGTPQCQARHFGAVGGGLPRCNNGCMAGHCMGGNCMQHGGGQHGGSFGMGGMGLNCMGGGGSMTGGVHFSGVQVPMHDQMHNQMHNQGHDQMHSGWHEAEDAWDGGANDAWGDGAPRSKMQKSSMWEA